jgi:integrase
MKSASMVSLVNDYLALRRGLGFDLVVQGWALLDFAKYADATGHHGPITTDLALSWAESSGSGPTQTAWRLSVVRLFARHRAVFDPATEIPSADLFYRAKHWKPPHIYSDDEISKLLHAATLLRPRGGLRPHTYVTLLSLLASTGLRISEARHLLQSDVDLKEGIIIVRESKCRKSRLVPLHATTTTALTQYATLRDNCDRAIRSEFFFQTDRAATLKKRSVEGTFCKLRERLGWTANGRARRPRIHDLRHTFAVRRLVCWCQDGADIDRKILALATYLGHAKVSDTYWYLSAVPELMDITSKRFEYFALHQEEGLP